MANYTRKIPKSSRKLQNKVTEIDNKVAECWNDGTINSLIGDNAFAVKLLPTHPCDPSFHAGSIESLDVCRILLRPEVW